MLVWRWDGSDGSSGSDVRGGVRSRVDVQWLGNHGWHIVRHCGLGDCPRTEFCSHTLFESDDLLSTDIEVPFEVTTHFSFHLIDLLQGKHLLSDNTP